MRDDTSPPLFPSSLAIPAIAEERKEKEEKEEY
jgi:hypothetical protein